MKNLKVVRLELKYCEHCGGLWLRRRGDCCLYCQRCRQIGVNSGPSNGGPLHKGRDAAGIGERVNN
jgi:hypothetical protein